MYSVYVLKASDGSFYIGQTGDLEQRIIRHNKGECRYTKSRLPVRLVYSEQFSNRSAAVTREKQLKSYKSRPYVEKLIKANGGPFV